MELRTSNNLARGRDFARVRGPRGATQVGWQAVLVGFGLWAAFFESVRRRRPAPEQREASPPPTPRSRSLGLAGRSWSVWVWVGSHTNWTGVVGCAFSDYDTAKARRPQTYAEPYLTIFAFGSDYFGSTSGAFGQVREIRIEPSTRFWQVWVLGARSVVSTGRSGRFV